MKQKLYVYIPGFEYDSKGPLHIDAIKLDVTVGTIGKGIENSQIKVYKYIQNNNPDCHESIEGNVIFRCITAPNADVATEQSHRYDSDNINSPCYTYNSSTRVLHGYFYDFITNDSEKAHHVIGIHNTPSDCLNSSSNFDVDEHDGLFVLELESLNTDLVLTFTFYSKTGNCEQDEENNQKIIIPNPISSYSDYFNSYQDNQFPDAYVEIGKWIQTYNPATSGVEQGEITLENAVPQYYNLKDWGTEEESWEVPLNADMLISDMSDQENLITIQSGKPIWAQYTYNSKLKKHEKGINLDCNKPSTYTGGKNELFYTNFYPGFQVAISPKTIDNSNITSTSLSSNSQKGAVFATKTGAFWCNRQYISAQQCKINTVENVNFTYNISNVDFSTLSYLYKTFPDVCVKNLSHDSTVGNTGSYNQIVVTLDHLGNTRHSKSAFGDETSYDTSIQNTVHP